ncbi:MAG: LytTR family DNA-binding domain-containing protein [Ginsengibacter sp.]
MIKAIIVDDEPHCCQTLATLVKRYCPEIEVAGIFHSGLSALAGIKTLTPQILFLDIEMPHMNGFELLEQVTDLNFELIFTTSYDQYAIKAFHFSALDYLLKPIDREELQKAVQKVMQRQQHYLPQQIDILLKRLHQPATAISKIALPTMEGLQMVRVDSVISCASEGNYTIFFLKAQKKLVVSRVLKEIEAILEDHSFARVHNSYIVNLNEIEKYIKGEGGYLVMSDGSSVDVSRSRKESLLKKLSPGQG